MLKLGISSIVYMVPFRSVLFLTRFKIKLSAWSCWGWWTDDNIFLILAIRLLVLLVIPIPTFYASETLLATKWWLFSDLRVWRYQREFQSPTRSLMHINCQMHHRFTLLLRHWSICFQVAFNLTKHRSLQGTLNFIDFHVLFNLTCLVHEILFGHLILTRLALCLS